MRSSSHREQSADRPAVTPGTAAPTDEPMAASRVARVSQPLSAWWPRTPPSLLAVRAALSFRRKAPLDSPDECAAETVPLAAAAAGHFSSLTDRSCACAPLLLSLSLDDPSGSSRAVRHRCAERLLLVRESSGSHRISTSLHSSTSSQSCDGKRTVCSHRTSARTLVRRNTTAELMATRKRMEQSQGRGGGGRLLTRARLVRSGS